jgi:hypothetical protein
LARKNEFDPLRFRNLVRQGDTKGQEGETAMRLACQHANDHGMRFCDAFMQAFDVGDSSPEIQEELEELRKLVETRDGQALALMELLKQSQAAEVKLSEENERLKQTEFNCQPKNIETDNKLFFDRPQYALVGTYMTLLTIGAVSISVLIALLR